MIWLLLLNVRWHSTTRSLCFLAACYPLPILIASHIGDGRAVSTGHFVPRTAALGTGAPLGLALPCEANMVRFVLDSLSDYGKGYPKSLF